jgi:hypothetical protein
MEDPTTMQWMNDKLKQKVQDPYEKVKAGGRGKNKRAGAVVLDLFAGTFVQY